MPDNAYNFYSNITFIESLKDLRLDIKRQSCNKLYKSFDAEVTKLKKDINDSYNEENNNILKNKIRKNFGNISTTFKALNDKVNKSDKTVKFITVETKKLKESVKGKPVSDNDYKKSKILYNKLMHTHTSLQMIEDIFNKAIEKIKNINKNLKDRKINSLAIANEKLKEILALAEEYNVSKLKRAQQKFEESKELRDFMYGKVNPKLAQLLSLDNSIYGTIRVPTPFGPIWIKRNTSNKNRIVCIDEDCINAPNYDKMWQQLDIRGDKADYTIEDMIDLIKLIIQYINQPINNQQNSLGTSVNRDNPVQKLFATRALLSKIKYRFPAITVPQSLSNDQKEAAAFLCGVLLFSESHEFRNPTGGTFERKAMKNVLRLAENGCINPFSKVFNRAKGRYIPAHDQRSSNALTGGLKQTQRLIAFATNKIPISTFLSGPKTPKQFFEGQIDRILLTIKINNRAVFQRNYILTNQITIQHLKNTYTQKQNSNNIPQDIENKLQDIIKLKALSSKKATDTVRLEDLPSELQTKVREELRRNSQLVNKLMNDIS